MREKISPIDALRSIDVMAGNVIFNCEQRPSDNATHLRSWHAVKDIASQALAALQEGMVLEAELSKLSDPVAVHANMLCGKIAKPSVEQILHLYPGVFVLAGGEAQQTVLRAID